MASKIKKGLEMSKVLVVDDMRTERLHTKAILEKAGYEVIEADCGRRAVQIARELQPQAIVMDFVMPDGDGFAATKELKQDEVTAHIPVFIVSMKAQESARHRALRIGATSYFSKPVNPAELIAAIRGA